MDQEYIIYLVVLRADLKVVVIKMRSVRLVGYFSASWLQERSGSTARFNQSYDFVQQV